MERPFKGLLKRVEREEIPLLRNQRVDEAFLKKIHPEVLIWAAGSVQHVPPIGGLEKVSKLSSLEYYLEGKRLPGKRVMVLGGGMVGVEAAEKLALEGCSVTVVEMLPELAKDMEMVSRNLILKRLEANPVVTLLVNTTVASFEEKEAVLKTPEGELRLPAFDWLLFATGLRPRPLPESLRVLVPEVHVIGDADKTGDVYRATQAGYQAGLDV